MSTAGKKPSPEQATADPGQGLRERVEGVGQALAGSLNGMIAGLPGRPRGPQMLADQLGMTVATASRLLKALGHPDPIAVVQHMPGPAPLRRMLRSARKRGAPILECEAVRDALNSFDALIREEAGDRSVLTAIMSAWLPDSRRDFELRRRQSVFKALAELKGASCALDLSCLLLHPSEAEPDHLDVLAIQGMFALDRMRPDAVVKFGTRRMLSGEEPRQPMNLDGEPAIDGLDTVRLDQFCVSAPAPLVARHFKDVTQYTLGPTGFGPRSSVDLVLAEVNVGEMPRRSLSESSARPFFFHLVGTPTRRALFDLMVHESVFVDCKPELVVFDTAAEGPGMVDDPRRDVDRLDISERIEAIGSGVSQHRTLDFHRYSELVAHACAKRGWNPEEFRTWRVQMDFPLHGLQICMAFPKDAY